VKAVLLEACSVSPSVSHKMGDLMIKRSKGGMNGANPSSLVEESYCAASGLVNEHRGIFLTTIFFLRGPQEEDAFHFRLKWTSESPSSPSSL